MKKIGIVVCFILGISGNVFSDIVTGPNASLDINGGGQSWSVPLYQDPTNGDLWTAEAGTTYETNNASIKINSLTFDADPSISYGISVTNVVANTSYSFSFMLPVSVPAGQTLVSSTLGLTVTDGGTPEDGVQLSSNLSSFIQQSFVNGTINAGVDLGNLPLLFSPETQTLPPFSIGFIPGPDGPITSIKITTSFTLAGVGDSVALTGRFNLLPIPEPSTYVLLIMGVLSLAWGYRHVNRIQTRNGELL